MSRIETLLSLLRLLRASGGTLDTRIRLQKEAYLLAISKIADFRASDFYYHHYGPYSRSVSDTLQYAVSAGLVSEDRETGDDDSFTKYKYSLTEKASDLLEQVEPDHADLTRAAVFLRDKNWRALELAATVRFLEINEGLSDRNGALDQAMSLKPATRGYLDEAKSILTQFG